MTVFMHDIREVVDFPVTESSDAQPDDLDKQVFLECRLCKCCRKFMYRCRECKYLYCIMCMAEGKFREYYLRTCGVCADCFIVGENLLHHSPERKCMGIYVDFPYDDVYFERDLYFTRSRYECKKHQHDHFLFVCGDCGKLNCMNCLQFNGYCCLNYNCDANVERNFCTYTREI